MKSWLWLIYYSFLKEPFSEVIYLLSLLKKAKSWLYICMATAVWGAYYGKTNIIKVLLPAIIIIYLIRNKVEGAYAKDLYEHEIKNGRDSKIIKDAYANYKKKCFFSKTQELSYEDWKQNEVNRICKDSFHG